MFGPLVAEFWSQVEDFLVTEYQVPRPTVRDDIRLYRERLASHGVTDLLYNAGPRDIAKAIHGQGFRQPPPPRSA